MCITLTTTRLAGAKPGFECRGAASGPDVLGTLRVPMGCGRRLRRLPNAGHSDGLPIDPTAVCFDTRPVSAAHPFGTPTPLPLRPRSSVRPEQPVTGRREVVAAGASSFPRHNPRRVGNRAVAKAAYTPYGRYGAATRRCAGSNPAAAMSIVHRNTARTRRDESRNQSLVPVFAALGPATRPHHRRMSKYAPTDQETDGRTDTHHTPPLVYYQIDDGLFAMDQGVSNEAWIRTDSNVDVREAR